MELHRRRFIQASMALALSAGLARTGLGRDVLGRDKQGKQNPRAEEWTENAAIKRAEKPLRILMLGGTMFLGPAAVTYAMARGHTVTLFNRGKTNPELFSELEKLRGDRVRGNIEALKGRDWDAVIDTTAYVPSEMRQMVGLLKDHVGHYAMVATANVYSSEREPGQDETAPVHQKWPDAEEVNLENYGPMKRGCEVELFKLMGERAASVRPSLIVGPRDPTDRFTYWPVRCMRGGDILAPVGPDEPVQFVDARDLARFLVLACEQKLAGEYNATGATGQKVGSLLTACIEAAKAAGGGKDAKLVWAPYQFLKANKVECWSDLPVWIPSEDPEQVGSNLRVGSKAFRAGMMARPLAVTVRETLAWWPKEIERRTRLVKAATEAAKQAGTEVPKMRDPTQLREGLKADREAEVLQLLAAQAK